MGKASTEAHLSPLKQWKFKYEYQSQEIELPEGQISTWGISCLGPIPDWGAQVYGTYYDIRNERRLHPGHPPVWRVKFGEDYSRWYYASKHEPENCRHRCYVRSQMPNTQSCTDVTPGHEGSPHWQLTGDIANESGSRTRRFYRIVVLFHSDIDIAEWDEGKGNYLKKIA